MNCRPRDNRWIRASLRLIVVCVAGLWLGAPRAEETDYPHGEFRDECSNCHRADSWSPARIGPDFDHAKHGFPLRGAHSTAACRACHASLDFTGNFIDRSGMARAHQTTRYPLVGTHRVVDCEACHEPAAQGQMQFVNTPVVCEACHMDDYVGTTNPDHQASGFSTDCAQCHTPTSWRGLLRSVNHDALFFPIYSGKHNGKWGACTDCHFNPGSFTEFSCILCHKHDDETKVTEQHLGISGFVYNGQSCFTCHPDGRK
jgi:hypothetical protein